MFCLFSTNTAVNGSRDISERLHQFFSAFTSEIYGIYLALLKIMFMRRNKYIVHTDSKRAINALKALTISCHPFVTKCAELSNYLIEKYVDIAFWWIPGHCVIKGNERADHAAKSAFLMKENFVPLVDAQRAAQNLIIDSWKDIWEQQTSNKLHVFHICIKPLKLAGLIRIKEVMLPRLRIGRTYYLLCSEPPAVWLQCQSILKVKHV
ncbi:hypothetical protein AVEN_167458-1 [Araneus ventricosus]|uniref:RNase H type-1 domain-containing protein n=1 Tax=Araneus ventricosus TaxID=182803 RepID=A0A4Y2EP87_ARAVE|nr:hypothetical protein AVEN_167458-1 [Araneus ventricosus]